MYFHVHVLFVSEYPTLFTQRFVDDVAIKSAG